MPTLNITNLSNESTILADGTFTIFGTFSLTTLEEFANPEIEILFNSPTSNFSITPLMYAGSGNSYLFYAPVSGPRVPGDYAVKWKFKAAPTAYTSIEKITIKSASPVVVISPPASSSMEEDNFARKGFDRKLRPSGTIESLDKPIINKLTSEALVLLQKNNGQYEWKIKSTANQDGQTEEPSRTREGNWSWRAKYSHNISNSETFTYHYITIEVTLGDGTTVKYSTSLDSYTLEGVGE